MTSSIIARFVASQRVGRITAIGTLAGLLLLLCAPTGCSPASGATAAPDTATAAVATVMPDEGAAERGSLHDLGLRFVDASGAGRELATLGGQARVVAMVYTSCAHTCPLIVAEMKRVEAALPPVERARVGFVLVSLDPARDTPAQLAAFAEYAALDPARWTLLTGSEDDVLTLAAALGVRYRAGAAGEIDHANVLTVLDASGRITYQQLGLGDAAATRRAVEQLLD